MVGHRGMKKSVPVLREEDVMVLDPVIVTRRVVTMSSFCSKPYWLAETHRAVVNTIPIERLDKTHR